MAKPSLDLGLMCLGVRKPEVPFSTHNGGSFIPEKRHGLPLMGTLLVISLFPYLFTAYFFTKWKP